MYCTCFLIGANFSLFRKRQLYSIEIANLITENLVKNQKKGKKFVV